MARHPLLFDGGSEWYVERPRVGAYRVQRRLWSNFAGSAYKFYRGESGFTRYFFTRADAQALADQLNKDVGFEPEE